MQLGLQELVGVHRVLLLLCVVVEVQQQVLVDAVQLGLRVGKKKIFLCNGKGTSEGIRGMVQVLVTGYIKVSYELTSTNR